MARRRRRRRGRGYRRIPLGGEELERLISTELMSLEREEEEVRDPWKEAMERAEEEMAARPTIKMETEHRLVWRPRRRVPPIIQRPILAYRVKILTLPVPDWNYWVMRWRVRWKERKVHKKAIGWIDMIFESEPEGMWKVLGKAVEMLDGIGKEIEDYVNTKFLEHLSLLYYRWSEEIYRTFTHQVYRLPYKAKMRWKFWEIGIAPYARRRWSPTTPAMKSHGQETYRGKFARGKGDRTIINIQRGHLARAVKTMIERPNVSWKASPGEMEIEIGGRELKGRERKKFHWVVFGTRILAPRRMERATQVFNQTARTIVGGALNDMFEALERKFDELGGL